MTDDVRNGERGPKGDHGQMGDTGDQGRQGEPGLVSRGERGPQGDHGQAGDAGGVGLTGPRGAPGSVSTRRLTVAFIVMAVLFSYLAWRQDQTNAAIEHTAASAAYARCLNSVGVIEQFNDQQLKLAAVDRRARDKSANAELIAVWTARIAIYEAGLFPVPDCEPLRP